MLEPPTGRHPGDKPPGCQPPEPTKAATHRTATHQPNPRTPNHQDTTGHTNHQVHQPPRPPDHQPATHHAAEPVIEQQYRRGMLESWPPVDAGTGSPNKAAGGRTNNGPPVDAGTNNGPPNIQHAGWWAGRRSRLSNMLELSTGRRGILTSFLQARMRQARKAARIWH